MNIPLKSEKRKIHRSFKVKPVYLHITRPIKETGVRKISFFLSVLLVAACLSCVSCMTEIKPVLKPRVVPIAQRIADQQKWLDQDIAARAITPAQAQPVRVRLRQIKAKYELLRSAGTLTHSDSVTINRMLDGTSEQIFKIATKIRGGVAR